MKSTKQLPRFSTLCIIVIFALLSIVASSVYAEEERIIIKENTKEPYQITSKIMVTNLNERFFVISEKRINLLYTKDEKANLITWTTSFVDSKGLPIDPERFKRRDRVKLIGSLSLDGKIYADKIILLEPASKHQVSKGSQNIKKVNGVWVN